jgi:5'-nucleotidase (lipoprotein e(P4) family)
MTAMLLRSGLVPALLVFLPACAASRPGPALPDPVRIPAEVDLPNAVHWFRNSAEYRASALQTFRLATERLRELAAGRPAGSWAVILAADETVLDNSDYRRRLAAANARFDMVSWNAWVAEGAATAIPGAADFIRAASDMGGRVAIVTNRAEQLCDATRENLRVLGIAVDVVLCRPSSGDKNPRFAAVANGSAAPGLPPLAVLMWVGHGIHDFPTLTQDVRDAGGAALDAFGRTYFILPNPMYGSWERNPRR